MKKLIAQILCIVTVWVFATVMCNAQPMMIDGVRIMGKVVKIDTKTQTITIEMGRPNVQNDDRPVPQVEVKIGSNTPISVIIPPDENKNSDTKSHQGNRRGGREQLIKLSELKTGDHIAVIISKVEADEVIKVPDEVIERMKQREMKPKDNTQK